MKKNYLLLINLLILVLITTFILPCNVYAASAKITASSTNVEVGESVTLNSSISSAASWSLDVSTTGGTVTKSDSRVGNTDSGKNENTTITLGTFKADKAGTYTVSLSGYVVDGDSLTKSNQTGSVTITVKEKETTQVDTKPTEEPTTPSEPTEPTPTEEPTTPAPTSQEQTFTDTNKTMYVRSDCSSLNVRKGPDSTYERVGAIYKDNEVTVLAIGSKGWYKIKTSSGIEGYVAGSYLTDEKPTETSSSVATLNKLNVSPSNLNETFSKDKFTYTMTVNADVDTVNVDATPTNNNANVTITGNTGLTTGTGNIISVRVVAEDGASSRTYQIKVTKLASEDENPNIIEEENKEEIKLGLKSLLIKDLKITPEFKNDIYEYKATLTDLDVKSLSVEAIASEENATVQITGADKIKEGENIITILVTSANGEATATYQIIVNKEKEEIPATSTVTKTTKSSGNEKILLAAGSGIAILVVILILVIVKKKDKVGINTYQTGDYSEQDDDDEMYNNNLNEYLNNNEKTDETEYNNQFEDDDEDDDWGTPKRGFMNKFRKSGRHF